MSHILSQYNEQLENTQKQWYAHLTDKNIPVHKRWEDFLRAPDELMCEDQWDYVQMPDIFESAYERASSDVPRYQYLYMRDFLSDVFDTNGHIHQKYLTHSSTEDLCAAIEVLLENAINRVYINW